MLACGPMEDLSPSSQARHLYAFPCNITMAILEKEKVEPTFVLGKENTQIFKFQDVQAERHNRSVVLNCCRTNTERHTHRKREKRRAEATGRS
jgi:hypothetical protein